MPDSIPHEPLQFISPPIMAECRNIGYRLKGMGSLGEFVNSVLEVLLIAGSKMP